MKQAHLSYHSRSLSFYLFGKKKEWRESSSTPKSNITYLMLVNHGKPIPHNPSISMGGISTIPSRGCRTWQSIGSVSSRHQAPRSRGLTSARGIHGLDQNSGRFTQQQLGLLIRQKVGDPLFSDRCLPRYRALPRPAPLVILSRPLSRSLDSRKTPDSSTSQTEYHHVP